MKTELIPAMTVETFVLKMGVVESMKMEALALAEMYGANVQIQIDVRRKEDIVNMKITEYNV